MFKTLVFGALAAGFAARAMAADAASPGAVTIQIHGMKFDPPIVTIAPGTKVTWVNEDSSPHTVADKGKVFRSAALDVKDSFSYTFAAPGEFTYFCTLHPMMVGKIVVKPPGKSS